MAEITLTIPERAYHGLVAAAAKNQMPLADLAGDVLAQAGRGYANLLGIGVVTSAAFVARIQPAEFGAILAAAEQDQRVAALVSQLVEARDVFLDDPRLPPALELLATAGLLAGPERVGEILSYEVPPPPPTALGQEWQSPSGRLYRVVQLQGQGGQFLPDDPTTPQRESLEWVEVEP